jgi:hypothetical protein
MARSNCLMRLFPGPSFTKRREPDYLSHLGDGLAGMIATPDTLENAGTCRRMGRLGNIRVVLGRNLGLV